MKTILSLLAAPALLVGGLAATPAVAATTSHSASAPIWADASADQYRPGDRYQAGRAYLTPRQRARQRQIARQRARAQADRRYSQRYDNRTRQCDRGVGGTAIGAIAGGALGNQVAGYGDKTVGTVLGAVLGGVVGNVVDRRDDPCRASRTRGYRR